MRSMENDFNKQINKNNSTDYMLMLRRGSKGTIIPSTRSDNVCGWREPLFHSQKISFFCSKLIARKHP